MIPNANEATCIPKYFSLRNAFKTLIICSSFFQYILDIIIVANCALDMVNKLLQNKFLKYLGF